MNRLLIVGAGGQGKVVLDIAEMMGQWQDIAFLDDKKPLSDRVIGTFESLTELMGQYRDVAIAIGDNNKRVEIGLNALELGYCLPVICHPNAVISKSASIDIGTVIMPNAVINAGAKIGRFCIINTSSTVDHDCDIGDGVHLSPGAHLGGGVVVKGCSWICLGSSVINDISIGRNSILAAGSVLLQDVGDFELYAGVPGKLKKPIVRS